MLGLPSCKQVSELSSALLDEELPRFTKMRLKMHLMMCDKCRRYQAQMKLTSETLRYWMRGKTMPESTRESILTEFSKHKH